MCHRFKIAVLYFVGMFLFSCSDAAPPSIEQSETDILHDPSGFFSDDELREIARLSPRQVAIPEDITNAVAGDARAARLGQFLFFDTRLSVDNKHSCATCHQPDHGFADPRRVSQAVGTTERHAPTLLNVGYQRWFQWDGSADTLWAQAIRPLEAPNEHGTTRLEIAHLVARDAALKQAYESIFGPLPELDDTSRFPESGRPVPRNPEHPHALAWNSMRDEDQHQINLILSNITKSIAAYQMTLVSLDAPFDRYVEGLRTAHSSKLTALTESQKRGLKLFISDAGCTDCHAGALMTNLEFHNLGMAPRGWLFPEDQGRYDGVEIVKNDIFNAAGPYSDAPTSTAAKELEFLGRDEETLGQFKTPTLRNVELTAPYMHGGQFETLEEVVRFYSELDEFPILVGHRDETLKHLNLNDEQIADIVTFLKSLTGRPLEASLTTAPDSPLVP